MLFYIMVSILIVIGIGVIVRHVANSNITQYTPITNLEFIWTSLAIALIVIPSITAISWNISKNNQMAYVEHLNGWETGCRRDIIKCTRDGPCRWSYQCDPYIVLVTYSCGTSKSPRTCTRTETRYHNCPYAKEEWNFTINTTIGDFNAGRNRLPNDYAGNPWRAGHPASTATARAAGVGFPQLWTDALRRVKADSAGPVTKFHEYENYVLASQTTVLKTSVENDINEFKSKGILPSIKRDIVDLYQIDNVYAIRTPAPVGFRDAASRLAAGMGTMRQGDIRFVLVNNKVVTNLDHYTNTLKAYWQSREQQGNAHALPKNAVVIVMATDGITVTGTRAFTGMPTGNEALLDALTTKVSGVPYTTDSIIGFVRHRSGAQLALDTLGRVTYISLQSRNAYKRENMNFYSYLKGDIHPTSFAKKMSIFLSILIGSLLWLIPLNTHCPTDTKKSNNYWRY